MTVELGRAGETGQLIGIGCFVSDLKDPSLLNISMLSPSI